MGFSEQHSIICLATDEEINNFKMASALQRLQLKHYQVLQHQII
jgi:hypothetical protein